MSLDSVIKAMEQLPPEERARRYVEMAELLKSTRFIPNPGPQTDAFFHPASVLLFGGAGGGGKSSLIVGLSLTSHTRSLIMTRQGVDSAALSEELVKMYGSRDGFVASPRPKLRTDDGKLIEFGSCQNEGDEDAWRGSAHDLKSFDEVTRFTEHQVRFIMAWNRTTVVGQRSRVVMTSNPPTSATGDWIIGYYRPWLDPTHHNPALPGELRWYVTDPDGKDMEVDGPEAIDMGGKKVKPVSRTFIPAKLSDNPYLTQNDDYERMLDSLQEPLRSAMRDGNFMLARKDGSDQLIPTEWVRAAMARWHESKPSGIGMSALGVDVAQGGCFDDKTEILTNQGWKLFDDLTGNEKVLTLDDNISKWGEITEIHKYKFNGFLNVKESSRTNFAITDNHNLIAHRNKKTQEYCIQRYDELPSVFWMKKHNDWVGENHKEITFTSSKEMPNGGTSTKIWTFSMLDWAEFLGWFVSEGCVVRSKRDRIDDKICIAQNPGDDMNRIAALLKRMGIKAHFGKNGHDINFVNASIGKHLKKHCGYLAKNKRVPEYIKNSTTEVIDRFLESFRLGDGTLGSNGEITYFSSSKLLIDDIQEMLCKVGRAGKFSIRAKAGSVFFIGDRKVIRKNDVYSLYENRKTTKRTKAGRYKDSEIIKNTVKKVPYDGYVYCVSTPLRTIMVRRGGIPMWSGNSDKTILAGRYDGWFDKLVSEDGKNTPTGLEVAALILKHRRNACPVVLDMGGGYGGSTLVHLKDNEIETKPYKGNEASTAKDVSGQIGFFNRRSQAWWQLREALDPSQPGGSPIALPDDPELLSDLTSPTYEVVRHNKRLAYKAEEKGALKKRLGRSPDRGDAVAMAWSHGARGHGHGHPGRKSSGIRRMAPPPRVNLGRENRRR